MTRIWLFYIFVTVTTKFLEINKNKTLTLSLEEPKCFDCHLEMYKCLNNAECSDVSGKCVCSPGFAGNDCSKVQCGSLANKNRPIRPEKEDCKCDMGWDGINCNICNRHASCDTLNPTGINGSCYSSLIPVKENYVQCLVTSDCSHKIISRLDSNITSITCGKVNCGCFPGRLLCGEDNPGVNLTEWFTSPDGPKGPGSFECTERFEKDGLNRNCIFTEPNMNVLISDFFGDESIKILCPEAGECLHFSEIPGYNPKFEQEFSIYIIILMTLSVIGLLSAVFFGVLYIKERIERDGYIPVEVEDQENLRRQEDMMSHHLPCTLMFKNIHYTIPAEKKSVSDHLAAVSNGRTSTDSFDLSSVDINNNSSSAYQNVVLEGIQGSVRPGQVLAIMGGSGAGKTTLLDILARKNKSGVVSGDILVNGEFIAYDKYRNIIGYVDQEDTLMDTLTVYETILYSALLRLPRQMALSAKQRRVQETMMELGIIHIANKRISNSRSRGLSGGEKRRVSIACELVTSPSILFLDEPTSGLDSYNAYNVIECLVSLARNYQRTVIFTIHQPRSNIYALFDHLLLLSKGRLVYSGPAQQPSIDHFAYLGYECPPGFNIADYLVDLTMHAANSTVEPRNLNGNSSNSGEHAEETSPSNHVLSIKEQQEHMLYSPKSPLLLPVSLPSEQDTQREGNASRTPTEGVRTSLSITTTIKPFISSELMALIKGYEFSSISLMMSREIRAALDDSYNNATEQDLESLRNRTLWSRIEITSGFSFFQFFKPKFSRSGANWVDQFRILSGRTFKNLYRNPDLLFTHYAICVIVAVICGLLYGKVDNSVSGFQNRLGVMFFICAVFGFGCLSSMAAFAKERLIFVRERANRYYSPITYFTAKIVFDIIPLRVIPPIVLGLICYHMIGLQPDFQIWLRFLLVLVLFNITAASCCLAISIVVSDQGIASLVATLFMLFEMLFGGLLLNKKTMPPSFQLMPDLSFFNFAFEALVVNEVAGLTMIDENLGLKTEVPGTLVLQAFGLSSTAYWRDVRSLGIMCGIFLTTAFLWLFFRVKEKRFSVMEGDVLFVEMNDEIVELRILYDTRSIKRLYKKYQELHSKDEPIEKGTYLLEQATLKYSMQKQTRMQQVIERETELLKKEMESKQAEIGLAVQETLNLKLALARAHEMRKKRCEYEVIEKEIQKIPEKAVILKNMEMVQKELEIIRAAIGKAEGKAEQIRNKFIGLVQHFHDIQKSMGVDIQSDVIHNGSVGSVNEIEDAVMEDEEGEIAEDERI